jgi:hypothetical protein
MEREEYIVAIATEALEEILKYSGDALWERANAVEGSAEWHKLTGQILAYGRMTATLDRLERCCKARHVLGGYQVAG